MSSGCSPSFSPSTVNIFTYSCSPPLHSDIAWGAHPGMHIHMRGRTCRCCRVSGPAGTTARRAMGMASETP